MSLVWRRSEVGYINGAPSTPGYVLWDFDRVHGPLHKLQNRTWHVFCTSSKKGLENWSSRFERLITLKLFRGVQGCILWKCIANRFSQRTNAHVSIQEKVTIQLISTHNSFSHNHHRFMGWKKSTCFWYHPRTNLKLCDTVTLISPPPNHQEGFQFPLQRRHSDYITT